ncbi:MAG: tetratricopeptide repeat protein [Candidatus Poribacteria bacterium]|nr:tetratricopeptide repeat protein [Candidatus Poribacteria bacterium]
MAAQQNDRMNNWRANFARYTPTMGLRDKRCARSPSDCLSLLLYLLCPILFCVLISATAFAQNRTIQEDYNAIQNAHDLYYAKKYAEAVAAYQALLKTPLHKNSKDSIRMNLGRCYTSLGDDALALKSFQAVIDDDPNGSYASQAVHQIGSLFRQRYQYKEAIRGCQQLVSKYPKTQTESTARYLIAQYLSADGRYDESIENYLSFLNDFPNSPYRVSALHSLVHLYRVRHRHADAEKLLQTHLRQKPNDVDLMEKLATLYKEQGKYAEALDLYRAALQQNPNNTSILKQLGELYAQQGQRDLAVHEWSKIIQNDSNKSYQYQQLGGIYTSHQMYEEAIQAYEDALRINPKTAYLYNRLADVYKIQGQVDMAVNTYLRALRAVDIGYSGRDTVIKSMAEIYEGEQQERLFEQITQQLQKNLEAEPQNLGLVLSLAEVFFYQGDLEASLEYFKRLRQLYPADRGRILEKYAQILERNQQPQAADFYQAIVTLFPNTHLAWSSQMKLVRFYERREQWSDALAILTTMTQQNSDSAAQLLLGDVWLHGIHDVEAALQTYQRLASQPLTPPQRAQVQLGIATCYILQGKSAAAEDILRPVADGTGKLKAEAQKLIGDAQLFRGDLEAAVAAYKSVLDIAMADPLSNDALDRIVLIQSNSDYSNEPLKRYLKALQSDLSGQTEAALTLCQQTMKEYPTALIVDDLWMLIGDIHQRREGYADAIVAYQEITALEASSIAAEAKTKIADIYRWQLGDLPEAQKTYSALIADYPESVIVAYARQQLDEIMKLLR